MADVLARELGIWQADRGVGIRPCAAEVDSDCAAGEGRSLLLRESSSEPCPCELVDEVPGHNNADRRRALHFAGASKANAHQHDRPDVDQVQRGSHPMQKLTCGRGVQVVSKIGSDRIINVESLGIYPGE